MPSSRRLNAQYILIQLVYWTASAAMCAYQAALLLHRGFSNTQVGLLLAVRCLAGVVAQPLVGGFADRHPQIPLKHIVTLCLGVAFFAGLAYMIPMGMAGTAVTLVFLGALEVSAYPLVDAMAVQFIQAGARVSYSLGRGLGSLAYGAASVLIGLQTSRFGVESTLATHSALVAALILTVAVFPRFDPAWRRSGERAAGEDAPPQRPKSAWRLLRDDPRFALMLAGLLLGITACLPMSNFMVNIIRDRGGGDASLGMGIFVMAASELPAAFLFERLYRKGRAGVILAASMGFVTLKALLILPAPTHQAVWLAQSVQMLGYGLFTPASVFYVSDTIPLADQVKGQTLMMMATNGMGGVLGSALGGWALDLGGVNAMLWLCAALGLAAAAVTALAARPGAGAARIRRPSQRSRTGC